MYRQIIRHQNNFDEVLKIISDGRLGLAVLLEDEKPIGVITDGDVRRLLKSQREKALQYSAGEFFTPNPKTISADKKLVEAEELMQKLKITVLIVTEQDKLVGVIHRYDI